MSVLGSKLPAIQAIVSPTTLAAFSLRGDERVLDERFGGHGLRRALARTVPRGSVLIIDRDGRPAERTSRADRRSSDGPRIQRRVCTDVGALPLTATEWSSFDLVLGRPQATWAGHAAEMVEALVAATRPGGLVAVLDPTGTSVQFSPQVEGWESDTVGAAVRPGTAAIEDEQMWAEWLHCAGARVRGLRFVTDIVRASEDPARFAQAADRVAEALADPKFAHGAALRHSFEDWRRRADAALRCNATFVVARRSVRTFIAMTP